MITVTFFLWHDPHGRRNKNYKYTADSVNRLKRQVSANLTLPHEFCCVTDIPEGLDPDIKVVPLDRSLLAPGTRYPKLQIFHPNAGETIGKRILFLDLDTIICGNLDPLLDRGEDIVLWANPRFGKERATRYNTSMILLTAGTRPQVWNDFGLAENYEKAKPRLAGTDQVWVSAVLPPDEAVWTHEDGVYWIRKTRGEKPKNARVITFAGKDEPTAAHTLKNYPWVKELTMPDLSAEVTRGTYYGDKAKTYDRDRDKEKKWANEQRAVANYLASAKGRVLDIPVGTGRFLSLYRNLGLKVLGLDVSEDMMAQARQKDPEAEIRVGDILNIDVESKSFESSVCIRLLNLITQEEMERAVSELCRVTTERIILSIRTGDKQGKKRRSLTHTHEAFNRAVAAGGFAQRGEVFCKDSYRVVLLTPQ